MEGQQAIEHALSLARERRQRDVDVLLSRDESLALKVHQGKVERVDQSTGQGLGIRVVEEGRTGIAFTERLEPAAIEKAFAAAVENAALQDPTEVVLNERLPEVPSSESLGLFNPALQDVGAEELARFALEVEAAARTADPRVSTISHLVVSRGQGGYVVASSHGVRYEQHSNRVGAYCSVLLEENGHRKSGSYGWARRNWEPAQAGFIGREAVRRGAELLGARAIPSTKLPVVLNEEVAPSLLGMYFASFSAEAAQKGRSRLAGRLGETIAEPTVRLLDDPHRIGAPGSRFLDAEGTATRPLPLIQDGVFANFMYHIESARREGRESTGHAGRSYSGGIGTRSHNLVLPTGRHDLEALCGLPERCLLVTELEGGSGCNPLSGDISIGVQGFLVENGRRLQPVDSVTIAGNFFDLLRNIKAVGDRYQPNLTTRFIPALLVEGFAVSG